MSGAVIVLLVFLAYLPALNNGFIWDDDSYVTDNLALRDVGGLQRIWSPIGSVPQFYPLVFTGFWVEYHLWGATALGYHVVNILLHSCAALLLWRVALRLGMPGAWLAAVIFGLHPVHVESVAWITERKNVLSAVFYFGSAMAFLRFIEPQGAGPERRAHWRWYGWALITFVAALLSKTVTCSLPVALMLVLWWRKGVVRRNAVMWLMPFVVIGAGFGIMTAWLEKHQVGAQGAEWSLTIAERLLVAGRAVWFYAGTLVYPTRLTFIYPRWNIDSTALWQWVFPLAAVVVLLILWRARNRMGRAPLAAALFFCATLAPALGFFDVYPMRFSFVADHFQYLASTGLIVLCSAWLSLRARSVQAILIAVLGVLTWQQVGVYRDMETLFRDTLTKNPTCWMAHNNLGLILSQQGKSEGAESHYREALRHKPDEGVVYYNLANLLSKSGRSEEAIGDYRLALRYWPNHYKSRNNLGVELLARNQMDQAEIQFREALKLKPDSAIYHSNLADALSAQARVPEAILEYQEALRLDRDCEPARRRLAALGVSVGP